MSRQGRNEPCACGSGKKYKRCCGGDRNQGPCAVCSSQTIIGVACKLCGKMCRYCEHHQASVVQTMASHVLRVHPESIPESVDRLMTDAVALAVVEQEAARQPELWQKLLDYMAVRKQERTKEVLQ